MMQPATLAEFLCNRISEETGCPITAEQLDSGFIERLEAYARVNCEPVGYTVEGGPTYTHIDLLRCVDAALRRCS